MAIEGLLDVFPGWYRQELRIRRREADSLRRELNISVDRVAELLVEKRKAEGLAVETLKQCQAERDEAVRLAECRLQDYNALSENLNLLRTEFEGLSGEFQVLRADKDQKSSALELARVTWKEQEQRIKKLQEQFDELSREHDSLCRQHNTVSGDVAGLSKTATDLHAQLDTAKELIRAKSLMVHELEQKWSAAEVRVLALAQEVDHKTDLLARSYNRAEEAEGAKDALIRQRSGLTSEIGKLHGQLDIATEQVKKLSIERQQENLEQKPHQQLLREREVLDEVIRELIEAQGPLSTISWRWVEKKMAEAAKVNPTRPRGSGRRGNAAAATEDGQKTTAK